MTWSTIQTLGQGRVNYRLAIDGWADEWVTSEDIAGSITQGRTRRSGLLYSGLQIRESVDIRDAKLSASSFEARIRSPNALSAFAKQPLEVAFLDSTVTESATEWTLTNAQQSNITVNDYYHVGSETIQITAKQLGPGNDKITVVRARRGTNQQRHYPDQATNVQAVPIWDGPPSMHGRRARLYAYGEDEAGTVDGTQIWLGIVDGHPQLDPSDNMTWVIAIRPVTDLLKQQIAPTNDGRSDLKIRGRYHSKFAPYFFRIAEINTSSGAVTTDTGAQYTTGLFETDTDFAAQLQSDMLAALKVSSQIDDISVATHPLNGFVMTFTLTATVRAVRINFASPFDGASVNVPIYRQQGSGLPIVSLTEWAASGTYFCYLSRSRGFFGGIVRSPIALLGPYDPDPLVGGHGIPDGFQEDPAATEVHNRLYCEGIDAAGISATDSVVIKHAFFPNGGPSGTSKEITATIASVSSADGYIQIDDTFTEPVLITEKSRIKFQDDNSGSLFDFMNSLTANSVKMNLGSTPAITSDDVNLSSGSDSFQSVVGDLAPSNQKFLSDRKYVFKEGVEIEEILSQELQMLGGLPRIAADGKLALAKAVPAVDAQGAALALDSSNIVTPGGGGGWPTFVANADGIVNVVRVSYSMYSLPIGPSLLRSLAGAVDVEVEFKNLVSIAQHKNRGLGVQTIAPMSMPAQPVSWSELQDLPIKDIADRYFRLFSDTYYIVEVDVLLGNGTTSVFANALVGDVARVTCPFIPNVSDGTMGITNKNALIIGRQWNLDPANEGAPGRIRMLMRFTANRGYAPSARITAATVVSGNQWDLTVDSNDVAGSSMWPSGTNLSDHFAAGYLVTAWQSDVATANSESGTVDSVTDPSTIRVTFAGTAPWGGSFSGTYFLRFKKASTSDDVASGQAVYAYQADNNNEMYDSSIAVTRLL